MQQRMSRLIELRRRFFARAAWWLVITLGAFILIAALSVYLREAIQRRMEDQVNVNLNEIQAALEE